MLVRRVARPMLASIFIAGGVDALRNPTGRAKKATPLIEKSQNSLPNEVTDQIPSDPETLVRINAAVQVGGGILLATGKAPRLASAALAGSLIPTTLAGHAFWNETDPVAKGVQRIEFFKNLSLLGGLLIAAVDTEGKPSIAWRGRRAAQAAVSALPLSSVSATTEDKITDGVHAASERAGKLAHLASERGSELAEVAQDRGSKWAEIAQERGSKWAELASKRGSELAEVAQERGSELADVAQDRGSKWAAVAADRARADGGDIASSLSDWTEKYGKKAKKQAKAAGKDAKKQFASARKDAEKQYKASRKDAEKQLQSARKIAEKKAKQKRSQLDDQVGRFSV